MLGRWDGSWRSAQLLRLSLGVVALSGTVAAAFFWTTSPSAWSGRKSNPKSEEEEEAEEELEEKRRDDDSATVDECELQPLIEEDQPATLDSSTSAKLPNAAASFSTPSAAVGAAPHNPVAAVAPHNPVAPWAAPAFSPFGPPWTTSQSAAAPGAGVPRRQQASMSPGEKRDLDLMFRHQERQEGRSPMIPDQTKARQRAKLSVRRRAAPALAALADEAIVNRAGACSSTSGSQEVAEAVVEECSQVDLAALDELLLAELGELDPVPSRTSPRSKKGRRRPKKKSKADAEVDVGAVDEADALPVADHIEVSGLVGGAEGAEGAECSFVGVTDGVEQEVEDAVRLGTIVREDTEVGNGMLEVGPRWMRMRLGPPPLEEEEDNVVEEAEGEADAEVDTDVDADIDADTDVKAEPYLAVAAAARSASQSSAATAAATAAAAAAALQAPGRLSEELECRTEDSSGEESPQTAKRQNIVKATGASVAGQALTPTTDEPSSRQCSEAGDESGHVPFGASMSSGSGDPSSYQVDGLESPGRRRHRAWADLTDSSEDEFLDGYIPPNPSPLVAALLHQSGHFRNEGPTRAAHDEKVLSSTQMCSAGEEVAVCEEVSAISIGTAEPSSANVDAARKVVKAKAHVAKAQPSKEPTSSRRLPAVSTSNCVGDASTDISQANTKAEGEWIEVASRRHNRPSRAAA